LKKLGVYDDVAEGKYRCFVCGRRINLENLGGLFKGRDGETHFVCNSAKCLHTVAEISAKIMREQKIDGT